MSNLIINPFVFGAAAAFVPTDFTNQEFWYDATDASTITESGGEVSDWTDKFNSHDLSQGTSARQPNTSSINSVDSIFFDSNDVFNLQSQSFTTSPCTQWGLITPVTAVGGHLWFMKNSGATINRVRVSGGDTISGEVEDSSGGSSTPGIAVASNGVTIAFVARHSNSTDGVIISDDDTTDTDTTVGTLLTAADQILVGATAGSGANGFNGHIHHLGMYSQRLDDTDTDTLMDYLKAEGGL